MVQQLLAADQRLGVHSGGLFSFQVLFEAAVAT
jgi:hypothetical protein